MTTTPKRRWPRFTLRTLFVVVTLFGLVAGWVDYSLNWIRQREELLSKQRARASQTGYIGSFFCDPPPVARYAPGLLWVFGEKPHSQVELVFLADSGRQKPNDLEQKEIKLARQLFPEAMVYATLQRTLDVTFELEHYPELP